MASDVSLIKPSSIRYLMPYGDIVGKGGCHVISVIYCMLRTNKNVVNTSIVKSLQEQHKHKS